MPSRIKDKIENVLLTNDKPKKKRKPMKTNKKKRKILRLQNSKNIKAIDASLSSNNSILSNDGILTKTSFVLTSPKNVIKSTSTPNTVSKNKQDKLIVKLINLNYDKIKQLKNGVSTRSAGVNKPYKFSNTNNNGTQNLINTRSKKSKIETKLDNTSENILRGEIEKKEIRVVIDKLSHIDSLVKKDIDIVPPNQMYNKEDLFNNSTSNIEDFLKLNISYEQRFGNENSNKILNTSEKLVQTVDSNFAKPLHLKQEPIDSQIQSSRSETENRTNISDKVHYEDHLVFENDVNANFFQSQNQYFNEYSNNSEVCSNNQFNFYKNQLENSMYDEIDKIISNNNMELQLHVQGFSYNTASIRNLIEFLCNFVGNIQEYYPKTNNDKGLLSENINESFIFRGNNEECDLDEYIAEKHFQVKNVVDDVRENGKLLPIKPKVFNNTNLLNNASHKEEKNINSFDSSHGAENNILVADTIYKNKENKTIIIENALNETVENDNLKVKEEENLVKSVDDNLNSKSIESDDELVPGKILWAKINSFPYWPCIIYPDSENKITKRFGRENNDRFRVIFFADNGRFAWVPKSNLMPYRGKDKFISNSKPKTKRNPYYISPSQKLKWDKGCQEADNFILQPIETRLNKFDVFLKESRETLSQIKRERRLHSISGSNTSLNSIDREKWNSSKVTKLMEQTKKRKFDLDLQDNISFINFCNEIKYLTGLSSVANSSEIKVYINGLWAHRLSNLSKRGSNRAKILADNKVTNALVNANIKTEVAIKTEPKIKRPNKSKSIPIEETIEDILKLPKNYLFQKLEKSGVCHVCLNASVESTLKCFTPNCPNWIHVKCTVHNNGKVLSISNKTKALQNNLENIVEQNVGKDTDTILCISCKNNTQPQCFVCNSQNFTDPQKRQDDSLNKLIKCRLNICGRYFHQECLRYWPQARLTITENNLDLICPSHVCQTCISDDPKINYIKSLKLIKCVKCPSSYHVDSHCIPAGTVFLTKTDIICPRHNKSRQSVCNTDWCFMCSELGDLICCETCPSSFHLECLKLTKVPDDRYICEQCESGRMPLYGEMVWAKHGSYRYWPGIIIPPTYVPLPVQRITHEKFSFCVRFLGSHDHSWLNRQRVYLYQDDDWRYVPLNIKSNQMFALAIEESHKVSEFLKAKKLELNIQNKQVQLVPKPYTKILFNRPVPPVKLQQIAGFKECSACNCDPNEENPCDLYSKCINRICYHECHPKLCLSGEKCGNQLFEKRQYAPVQLLTTKYKGYGLFSKDLIPNGSFVIEYVGELIDDAELKRRIALKMQEKDEHFYFLILSNNITIDAGPKGNLARFMNHSCNPNCEAQTWIVNGYQRIGLFAIQDIPPNTELTFHYNLECFGENQTRCFCGSENCTGFIGTINKKSSKNLIKRQIRQCYGNCFVFSATYCQCYILLAMILQIYKLQTRSS